MRPCCRRCSWRSSRPPAASVSQEAATAVLGESRLPPHLPPDLADELPEGAGVYLFRAEGGALLYVGKSRNLRSRVLEHFASEHRSAKEAKLTRQVRGVEWIETGGELGALLLESRLVKELAPSANRRLRKPAGLQCVRLEPVGRRARGSHRTARGAGRGRRSRGVRPVPHASATHGARSRARHARRACASRPWVSSAARGRASRCSSAVAAAPASAANPARCTMRGSGSRWSRCASSRGRSRAPIGIRERGVAGEGSVLHVIDQWRHLGTAADEAAVAALLESTSPAPFDPDGYRIVARCLERAAPRDLVMLGGGRA